MKTVILDAYAENHGDLSWDWLTRFGQYRLYDFCTKSEQEIIERIGDSDIVITNKTPVSRHIMDACQSIKYISILATGYDIIDTDCAAEKGIPVSNIPAYGTAAVAQHAIALLLELCNKVSYYSGRVHEGHWGRCSEWCFWDEPILELSGKTMGIIGFGRIGQAVGRIASALGMKVLAYNRHHTEGGRDCAEYTDLDTLFAASDVISLHCPLNDENTGLINSRNIAKMKDGAIIINNSRGGLVVDEDLAEALSSGKVAAAGLDVISQEPIPDSDPLLKCENCVITPHISWASFDSRRRIMEQTERNIEAFLAGKSINVVNGL